MMMMGRGVGSYRAGVKGATGQGYRAIWGITQPARRTKHGYNVYVTCGMVPSGLEFTKDSS